jgi:hypothetical protein
MGERTEENAAAENLRLQISSQGVPKGRNRIIWRPQAGLCRAAPHNCVGPKSPLSEPNTLPYTYTISVAMLGTDELVTCT